MGQSAGHFQKWERLSFPLLLKLIMEVLMSNSREKQQEEEKEEEEVERGEEVIDHEILKRRISTHPSYGLLVEAHLGCLKVGDNGELESYNHARDDEKQQENIPSLGMASRSELDHFMEAYCLALRKLKEAMEEPQQKSMAFINNMHSQLQELTGTHHPGPADLPATSSAE
ncbi:homeobox protein knotted-1-like 1 [Corylus avellana]|uniref:homeobox protein knotted-1-like 1 n=1 Tax=Corylus avellana TaxID=13451 RepID=UPI00286CEEE4|nr:homeobox protein knotted-1-like 1 [Corylus avellana]